MSTKFFFALFAPLAFTADYVCHCGWRVAMAPPDTAEPTDLARPWHRLACAYADRAAWRGWCAKEGLISTSRSWHSVWCKACRILCSMWSKALPGQTELSIWVYLVHASPILFDRLCGQAQATTFSVILSQLPCTYQSHPIHHAPRSNYERSAKRGAKFFRN